MTADEAKARLDEALFRLGFTGPLETAEAGIEALEFLLAELARKDEALRHLAGVAERAYGKALIEYRREQPDARPEECWAEFEALGDVAAALGEQP